jgi:hypothetical protein
VWGSDLEATLEAFVSREEARTRSDPGRTLAKSGVCGRTGRGCTRGLGLRRNFGVLDTDLGRKSPSVVFRLQVTVLLCHVRMIRGQQAHHPTSTKPGGENLRRLCSLVKVSSMSSKHRWPDSTYGVGTVGFELKPRNICHWHLAYEVAKKKECRSTTYYTCCRDGGICATTSLGESTKEKLGLWTLPEGR